MQRHGTPALTACVAIALVGLFAAVAFGRPELAAVAAPFALLAVIGVVGAEEPQLQVRLRARSDRVLEGDPVEVDVEVQAGVSVPRLELLVPLTGPAAGEPGQGELTAAGPSALGWTGPVRAGDHDLAGEVRSTTWGVARLGPVVARAHGPLGLVRWEGQVAPALSVRVLPDPATLDQLLPLEARAIAGAHRSRLRGDGFELADLRPYQPGDRLRSVNWRVSSRRPELWVDLRHPDRSGDLVVVVDTFADRPDGAAPWLRQAVRGAWGVAGEHLRAHDRVGFLGFGGYPTWVRAGQGARTRYEVLDRLLVAHAAWTEAPRSVYTLPGAAVPAGSDIVAFTPLHDERMVAALGELRRRGHGVVAVVLEEPATELPERTGWAEAARLWRLLLAARARDLAGAGVATVPWRASDGLPVLLGALRSARRPPVRGPAAARR